MTDPNRMTGYDAATVEACASVAELLADAHEAKSLKLRATGDLEDLNQSVAYARSANIRRRVAVSIRALPIAPPVPAVDDTADDVAFLQDAIRSMIQSRFRKVAQCLA